MTSATPRIIAVEMTSAWVVIVAVSLVTLPAALLCRKLIGRPGGLASGLLLTLPLTLPLVAAAGFARAMLPEVAVLAPAGRILLEKSRELTHLLFMPQSSPGVIVPYAVSGSAGRWLLLIGSAMSSFMLLRRLLGAALRRRLVGASRPPAQDHPRHLAARVEALAAAAGLQRPPEVLIAPPSCSGAFALGRRPGRILISEDVLRSLDDAELDALLAHEIAHLKARDVPIVVLGGLLRDAVAWNPIAHLAFRRLVVDRELEADRRAALITGQPLALASGLLKVCELRGRRGRLRARSALGLAGGGGRVSRRVSSLIALSETEAVCKPPTRLRYLAAVLLVGLLGLEAGSRLTDLEQSAVAIVWGAPSSAGGDVWAPRVNAPAPLPTQTSKEPRGRRGPRALGIQERALLDYVALKEEDVAKWVGAMKALLARQGGPAPVPAWRVDQDWRAYPLISGRPLGLYRMSPQPPIGAMGAAR